LVSFSPLKFVFASGWYGLFLQISASSNQSLDVGELLVDSSGAPTKSGEGVEKLGKQGLFVKKVGLFIAITCNGNGVGIMLSEKKL
jgi:hypothetical protein